MTKIAFLQESYVSQVKKQEESITLFFSTLLKCTNEHCRIFLLLDTLKDKIINSLRLT
jgi:hypothetical protein